MTKALFENALKRRRGKGYSRRPKNPKIFKIFKIYNDDSITENESLYCRPEFSELINDAKKGKFTTIIVPSIDKLTRTHKEYLSLKSLLKELNIRLIVANIPF